MRTLATSRISRGKTDSIRHIRLRTARIYFAQLDVSSLSTFPCKAPSILLHTGPTVLVYIFIDCSLPDEFLRFKGIIDRRQIIFSTNSVCSNKPSQGAPCVYLTIHPLFTDLMICSTLSKAKSTLGQ